MPRQRLYRADVIVLKRMSLGEADRVLTLYSRDHGKLRAIAKGVRRMKSRSAGHLELFTHVDAMFAVGRELDVLSQAQTVTAFRNVREQLTLTAHAYYMTEVTDLLTEDRLENAAIFDALLDGLTALDDQLDPRIIMLEFQMRLLDALGYRPELVECVHCRATLRPGSNFFSPFLGGALCPSCGPRQVTAKRIGTDGLKLLRNVQRSEGRLLVSAREDVCQEAETVLRDYTERLIERRFRTPALIAQVRGTEPVATL